DNNYCCVNTERCPTMPGHVVLDQASPGSHLTRILISMINAATDCSQASVRGKVIQKGPLVSLGDEDFVLKAVIEEEASAQSSSARSSSSISASINVILFGPLARDFSEAVNQGEVVVVTGFTVGKSPTAHKDRLHPCNLLLSAEDACLYVLPSQPPRVVSRSPVASKRTSPPSPSSEVSKPAKVSKVSKYTYVPLNELKPGAVVNVYGVVVFFKQPYKTRGTDYCSSLKITDQSNQKVGCNIFCERLEDHPKVFQLGDIIRMHRVKTQAFGGSISLLNTFGFSVVTFDGRPKGPVVPRTSSKSFQFESKDERIVEELRTWAADQDFLPTTPRVHLSGVQPQSYFDLTCQLLWKAPVDNSCLLLKVWDGTRCPHPLQKFTVEASAIEGPSSLSRERSDLAVVILVFDNHADIGRHLKAWTHVLASGLDPCSGLRPGPMFWPQTWTHVLASARTHVLASARTLCSGLRPDSMFWPQAWTHVLASGLDPCFGLRPGPMFWPQAWTHVLASARTHVLATVLVSQGLLDPEDLEGKVLRKCPTSVPCSSGGSVQNQLAFHLHGGTSFGRGLRVLPDDSPDIQELRRVVESIPEDDNDFDVEGDSAIMETWGTPPETMDDARGPCATERRCSHALQQVTLEEVKQSAPDQRFHVTAQLKSYQPRPLYQALKLHCPKCRAIQEIPDDDFLSEAFSEASKAPGCVTDPWLLTESILLPGDGPQSPGRSLSIHLSKELCKNGRSKDLIYVTGATLEDVCQLAAAYQYMLPVMSSGGSASLMDFSVPFLFRGTKRYYGCKQCSQVSVKELKIDGSEEINEEMIAEAMGVQLLQYGLLMKLQLQQGPDTLEVLLWRDAETFFQVSLEDVAANQEAQNKIRGTMDFLCPPGGSIADHPWLDLCLTTYTVQEDDGLKRVCYQVCQTSTITTPA
ncbi:hypothetical protein NHX12_033644, partial [Muraenolepis orangiensis]